MGVPGMETSHVGRAAPGHGRGARRTALWVLGLWALAGCQQWTTGGSAVRVEISYATFQPGCLSVTASDAADASHTETQQLEVQGRSANKTVAVFRKADWSRQLVVTASAREGSCTGPEVATSTQQIEMPEHGASVAYLDLRAEDLDGDGFVSVRGGGTDCDDTDPQVHPGAPETCDGKDSNCSGDEEDAPDKRTWYVDQDQDGYGSSLEPTVQACAQPPGYVAQAGDCLDTDPKVHPGQAETLCDKVDENCDGHVDESFHAGEPCVTEAQCSGFYECTTDHLSAFCYSRAAPTTWYVDQDGDGRYGTSLPLDTCAQPSHSSATRDDCDDSSRFIGGPEVCDRLDNNCDGTVDEGVCGTVGWTQNSVGAGTAWTAVTTYAPGQAWVAGASGQLRHVEGTGSTDASSACGSTLDWTAAWARPSDGRVFLGSATGQLATVSLSGLTCDRGTPDAAVSGRITGLVGFEQSGLTTVFAVTSGGHVLRWDWRDVPASLPAPHVVVQLAANLRAVHGVSPGTLLAVGAEDYQLGGDALPRVFQLDTATSTWTRETLPADTGTGYLRGVSVVDEDRAYAVGDQGLVLMRQAGAWSRLPSPAGAPDLLDVVAFHPTVVLALSNQSAPTVHLYNGTAWSETYHPTQPLRSLDALDPTEQWAAGEGGAVVRWGAP